MMRGFRKKNSEEETKNPKATKRRGRRAAEEEPQDEEYADFEQELRDGYTGHKSSARDQKPRVSILIPIYNAEQYLDECLTSVVEQILENIEIICINDGSTDDSLKIIQEYAAQDPRIKIIDKKNTGYGDSMNRGIQESTGEYIGIVEPDDFVDVDMFADLYALAKKHRADVARSSYFEYRNGRNTVYDAVEIDQPDRIIDTTDDTRIFYKYPAIWSAIYRRKFLDDNDIRFQKTPGASYQDASFNFKTLASEGKLVLTDKPYYHYRRDNTGSSVKSKDPQKIYAVNEEYACIEKYLRSRGTYKTYGYVLQPVKFAAYHWNMLRLDKKDLKKYVLRMRAEFTDARVHKLLKKRYFPKKHWFALKLILKYPPWIFLTFFKLYSGSKSKGL